MPLVILECMSGRDSEVTGREGGAAQFSLTCLIVLEGLLPRLPWPRHCRCWIPYLP